MMQRTMAITISVVALTATPATAAEICGNGIDDDADGYADESCGFANWVMGGCDGPQSCLQTGEVDPVSGAWVFQLPPDFSPTVPFGPAFEFRRTYMSMYAPPAVNYRTAMGPRWQHNFQGWLDKSGTSVVVHLPTGQEVKFTYTHTPGDGYDYYNAFQPGAHYKHLRQATSNPNQWELRTLTGEVYVFNWSSPSGKLIEIRDSLATPNKITIAYLSNGQAKGQIDTVTDASAKKRYKFTYSSGLATTVAYQTGSGGTWTTRVSLSISYTSTNPTTVQIAGSTVYTNTYLGGYLTSIADGSGKSTISANYVAASPGRVSNLTSATASSGFDYASSYSQCLGQTGAFYNLANGVNCDIDTDCGTGLRCGGKTGTGATGKCYRAAKCLTTISPSETLITTVAPFTPCTGACAPVTQYSWNTTTLDLRGRKFADSNWTSFERDANGMIKTLVEGDSDDDATNAGGAKTWFFYGNVNFPGKVTEVRRRTDTPRDSTCSATSTVGCKQSLFAWTTDGLLDFSQELGFTDTGGGTAFTHTTDYVYDAKGRITSVDGPLAGTNDITEATYWTSADVFKDGYPNLLRHKKNATEFLTTTFDGYDYFGNSGSVQHPDGTFTCKTWDSNRNYLSVVREAMAGQTSCSSTNSADLVTAFVRDASLRLTRTTLPSGDCQHKEYDAWGRLSNTRLRDDCNAGNPGETMTQSYTTAGLPNKTEYFSPTGSLTRKSEATFLDGTQVGTLQNPVSPSYSRTFAYLADAMFEWTIWENNLGGTQSEYDSKNRQTKVKRFITGTTSLDWTRAYPLAGETSTRIQQQVTDPSGKVVTTNVDDLGRRTSIVSPDSGTTRYTYNSSSTLATTTEAVGAAGQVTHTFAYDNIGRRTVEDYGSEVCAAGNPIDTEYTFDALPVGDSCPAGATCTRLAGRLARVKSFLLCTNGGATGIFQSTYYGYDDAGRLVSEYIIDTTGRSAHVTYTWDKNGNLVETKAPSLASMTSTYGGGGNSDANLVTAVGRSVSGVSTSLITGVTWAPFGPVTQYDQENTVSGNKLRAVLTWNLAYRASQVRYSASAVNKTTIDYTEDERGRYTQKLYSNVHSGIVADYLKYDWLDRVTCDSAVAVGCPTAGTTGYTNVSSYNTSNDRAAFRHGDPIYGDQSYTVGYNAGTDKIAHIDAASTGRTIVGWNSRGDRSFEDADNNSVDRRDYTYDGKRRVRTITSYYRQSGFTYKQYRITYAFDEKDRVIFRSFANITDGGESNTFYYYDLLDRLIEVKVVPSVSSPSTYTIYNFYWLGQRPIALWALAFPAATTARYFLHADDRDRVLEVYTWPTSGDAVLAWALNPDAFGWDNVVTGTIFQPLRLANSLVDDGTLAWSNADPFSPVASRPPLLISGPVHFDPMTGTSLQRTGEWPDEPYGVGAHDPGALLRLTP